jgi:DNA-binding NtrC family response regulator
MTAVPLVVIIDDLVTWSPSDRRQLLKSLGLTDVSERVGVAEGVWAEARVLPAQLRRAGEIINDASVAADELTKVWEVDSERRCALVLLDNQFDYGPVKDGPIDPDTNWPPYGDREFGLRILEAMADRFPDPEVPGRTIIPVVALSRLPRSDLEAALNRLGNLGYLERTKADGSPVPVAELKQQLADHLFESGLVEDGELRIIEHGRIVAVRRSERIVGRSVPLLLALRSARRAARAEIPCFLTGPAGSGKELLARYIHDHSRRSQQRFIAVNSAALPEGLIESELFGYAPNSGIAGAEPRGKPGSFELADGGTIFLDEIGDMSLATQAKVLRVLQDGLVKRLSATAERRVDVRVLAATNKDLGKLIREGGFRGDLYDRVAKFIIRVPSLSERGEDIPALFDHFLERASKSLPGAIWPKKVDAGVYEALRIRRWEGNVRELESLAAVISIARKASPYVVPNDVPGTTAIIKHPEPPPPEPNKVDLGHLPALLSTARVPLSQTALRGSLNALQEACGELVRRMIETALAQTKNLGGEARPTTAMTQLLGTKLSATQAYRELLRLEKHYGWDRIDRQVFTRDTPELARALDKARANQRSEGKTARGRQRA